MCKMCKRGCLKFGRDQIIIRRKDTKKFFSASLFLKKSWEMFDISKKKLQIYK